jgi:histidine triad (HIT) family protein
MSGKRDYWEKLRHRGAEAIQLPTRRLFERSQMQTDSDCVFCKIVEGQIPSVKLLEDDATLAVMDINPAHDGHCLVITKSHYPTVFEINEEAFVAVAHSVHKVARAVNLALSPEGLNLVQANGEGAKQSVNHFHMHVLPRKFGDDLKLDWGLNPGIRETIAALADKIRAHL